MPSKTIDSFLLEFSGELLVEGEHWGAFVSILAPSSNPMHMTSIVPKRRVATEQTFTDQHAAEAEAERAATELLEEMRH